MNSLNSVLLEGNLTRDPTTYETPNGSTVCNFSIASNRFFRQNEALQKEVSYFDIEAWARQAERCGDALTKGRGVRVVGRLKQDRWTDKDGNNRSKVKVVAMHVEFKPDFRKTLTEEEQAEEATEEAAVEEQNQELVTELPI